jgi:hypothetical protein
MKNYYVAQKNRLLKNHDKLIKLGMDTFNARYAGAGEQIAAEARHEFEQLIPQIPYIGGKKNRLTDTIEQMTSLLALYRVLKARGVPVEEIGALVQQMATAHIESFPSLARQMIGRFYMSHFWRKSTRKRALESQQRQ